MDRVLARLWAHITATVLLLVAFALTLIFAFPGNAQGQVTVQLGPNDQVAEFVAAVQSVVSQYDVAPFVITSGTELAGVPIRPETYVSAKPGVMMWNQRYSTDPEYIETSFADDLAENYHSPGCSAQTYLGIHEAAHQIDYTHNMRARTAAINWALTVPDYRADELSGYSFDQFGMFSPAEALAEAFAAVKCDPKGSTPAEYDLYNILITTQ